MTDTDAPVAEHRGLADVIHGLAEHVHRRFDAIETNLQAELAHLRDRQATIATAIHHILQRDTAMSDLTDAIRAEIASVSGDVDTLIARKRADDTTALTDIKSDMDALKSKVAAALVSGSVATPVIRSVVEPAEAGNVLGQAGQGSADGTIITNVTAPTTAGQTVLPVSQVSVGGIADALNSAHASGAALAVSGPGIADGTTVASAEPTTSTITLSSPTTAAHAGDGSEVLTIAPPVSAEPATPAAAPEIPAA